MSNDWNIPDWLEKEVRRRDKNCVYCGVALKSHARAMGIPRDKATFEHIHNDGPPSEANIAMCCGACNSSKGVKKLMDWLASPYCKVKNINTKTVAPIVKAFIKNRGL